MLLQLILETHSHLLIRGVHGVLSGAIDVNEGLPWEFQVCCQPPVCLHKPHVLWTRIQASVLEPQSLDAATGSCRCIEEGCMSISCVSRVQDLNSAWLGLQQLRSSNL